jgi:excisionase family DNA binding protein
MGRAKNTANIADYLTVGEAAEQLGVSRSTLRNWDKANKLKPYRHPVNGYRLYRRQELEKLLTGIKVKKVTR